MTSKFTRREFIEKMGAASAVIFVGNSLITKGENNLKETTEIAESSDESKSHHFQVLALFPQINLKPAGSLPKTALLDTGGGIFYGTTELGGKGGGTIYRYRLDKPSVAEVLYSFAPRNDGSSTSPNRLVLGTDQKIYGTTHDGGKFESGSLFCFTQFDRTKDCQLDAPGNCVEIENLKDFSVKETGSVRPNDIILGNDGIFYGTTQGNSPADDYGSIFSFNPKNKEFKWYPIKDTDRSQEPLGRLLKKGNTLYGTSNGGAVFTILTDLSNFQVIARFKNIDPCDEANSSPISYCDGVDFFSGLVEGKGNYLYGTTYGGHYSRPSGCGGFIYRVKAEPGSEIEPLYKFRGHNGAGAGAELLKHGNTFYGVTGGGGDRNLGTIFKFKEPKSKLKSKTIWCDKIKIEVVHYFNGIDDAGIPAAPLIYSNSFFYGAASNGGNLDSNSKSNTGALFRFKK